MTYFMSLYDEQGVLAYRIPFDSESEEVSLCITKTGVLEKVSITGINGVAFWQGTFIEKNPSIGDILKIRNPFKENTEPDCIDLRGGGCIITVNARPL